MNLHEVELVLKRNLLKWPPFEEGQLRLETLSRPDHLWISFRTVATLIQHSTHFDVNVDGSTFYLLHIELEDRHRNKGLGSQLYQILEKVAQEIGCRVFEQTPSGWTPRGETRAAYLQRRGYTLVGDVARKEFNTEVGSNVPS